MFGLVLAILVLRRRRGGTGWAVAGVIAAVGAISCTVGEVPVSLVR